MTESKTIAAIVRLDKLSIDGYYRMPDEEFRVSITGVSVLLGYKKDWFSRLCSDNLIKLRTLERRGFKYAHENVSIPRQGGGGAIRQQTISIKDLTTLITLEALFGNQLTTLETFYGNKRAMALQAAFTLDGLDALFRDAFRMPEKSQSERQKFFRLMYNEFLGVFTEDEAELKRSQVLSDELYFLVNEHEKLD